MTVLFFPPFFATIELAKDVTKICEFRLLCPAKPQKFYTI